MSDNLKHLHKLLTNAQENLHVIEEQISHVIDIPNVPLSLLKNKRHWQAEINRLANAINQEQRRQQPADTGDQARRMRQCMVAFDVEVTPFDDAEQALLLAVLSFLARLTPEHIAIRQSEVDDEDAAV